MDWLESIPFIAFGVWACFKTPVSEHRRYGAWRQGCRDAMHNFAYGFAPVPRSQRGKAP